MYQKNIFITFSPNQSYTVIDAGLQGINPHHSYFENRITLHFLFHHVEGSTFFVAKLSYLFILYSICDKKTHVAWFVLMCSRYGTNT